ncbi:uncharacterized protein LOC114248533 [Bombyx mandarina]|uniref:Uncharacterized protein LOC114248533 n=1 Tax=Bombyx mandarina TaxID=7092 RepID=A0A6J2K7N3_BOMMA|nr:uncharacterized protein LOC114248533 [Bombyx mandarina]
MHTSNETVVNESLKLSKALPKELYERVCTTLDIPTVNQMMEENEKIKGILPRRSIKEPMLSNRKCLLIDRGMDSDTDVEYCPSDDEETEINIHQELLKKPIREQITWNTHYLQPEREDEKTLIKKADDLTERIANEFCEYMKQLGGEQQSNLFSPKAIKELFQIEFDTHVARSLRVISKELPTIDEKIAAAVGKPEKSCYAALEREISRDIKAENCSNKTNAFGQSLPRHDQYRAPNNNTKNQWRSARYVPKDLVTLKAVWEGITNLRSVREYCRWMIDHPEHRRPPYLNSLGMFDPAVLEAKMSFQNQYHEAPTQKPLSIEPESVEHIRRRLSELAETNLGQAEAK